MFQKDAAIEEHRDQRIDGSGGGDGRGLDAVPDREGGLIRAWLRPEPSGGPVGVSAREISQPKWP